MKQPYIKRTYRISKDHDKLVKKNAKKKSESEVVRNLIDTLKSDETPKQQN